jgi:hypothetical protein
LYCIKNYLIKKKELKTMQGQRMMYECFPTHPPAPSLFKEKWCPPSLFEREGAGGEFPADKINI